MEGAKEEIRDAGVITVEEGKVDGEDDRTDAKDEGEGGGDTLDPIRPIALSQARHIPESQQEEGKGDDEGNTADDAEQYPSLKGTPPTAHTRAPRESVGRMSTSSYTTSSDVSDDLTDEKRLHKACANGNMDEVRQLVEVDSVDVNVQDAKGWTPLLRATQKERVGIVRYLLSGLRGTDVNLCRPDGWGAIHVAAQNDNLEIMTLLIDHDADVNMKLLENGASALFVAVQTDSVRCMRILYKSVFDGSALPRMEKRWSCLHLAAARDSVDCIKALVTEANHPIDDTNDNGSSPLYLAAQYGRLDSVRTLLDLGASVSYTKIGGSTPLHIAAACSPWKWIVKPDPFNATYVQIGEALIKAGSELNQADAHGNTPLHVCARCNSVEFGAMLLERSASIHARNKLSLTPAELSKDCRSTEMEDLLNTKATSSSIFAFLCCSQAKSIKHIETIKEL